MLTVEEVRRLLGDLAPERDEDVIELRNLFHGLANVVIDSLAERAESNSRKVQDAPAEEAVS